LHFDDHRERAVSALRVAARKGDARILPRLRRGETVPLHAGVARDHDEERE